MCSLLHFSYLSDIRLDEVSSLAQHAISGKSLRILRYLEIKLQERCSLLPSGEERNAAFLYAGHLTEGRLLSIRKHFIKDKYVRRDTRFSEFDHTTFQCLFSFNSSNNNCSFLYLPTIGIISHPPQTTPPNYVTTIVSLHIQ